MNETPKVAELKSTIQKIEAKTHAKPVQFIRFDVFKGAIAEDGTVSKVRSVGSAYVREGHQTYTIVLKTFLKDKFYLLPNTKSDFPADYVILTREPSFHAKRKFFWNSVGEGKLLEGQNHGIMKLSWDMLTGDIYMGLTPLGGVFKRDESQLDAA